jgi:hypothetical protein
MLRHSLLPLSFVVLTAVLAGCDATGSQDTAVLNANSAVPPIVEYEVRYTSENVHDNGQRVSDSSNAADNLDAILRDNGFGRSDVVSAEVDSVVFIRRSSESAAAVRPKVFPYLTRAAVFLGTGTDQVRIAEGELVDQDRLSIPVVTRDVTAAVRAGRKKILLRLTADGDVPSEDVIDVEVYCEIEVGGV